MTCTFTIETGTLPDADIAIDSWSHFPSAEDAHRRARPESKWAVIHEQELSDNWERARRGEPLEPIAPLE